MYALVLLINNLKLVNTVYWIIVSHLVAQMVQLSDMAAFNFNLVTAFGTLWLIRKQPEDSGCMVAMN